MNASLPVPASHIDLVERRTGVLATVDSHGQPQVTAIWFLLDEDGIIRTSLLRSRQKYKNMLSHPRATLFVIDGANPFRTLEMRCEVTFAEDLETTFFERIVRYYGQDPETFPAPRENRVILELRPIHVVTNG